VEWAKTIGPILAASALAKSQCVQPSVPPARACCYEEGSKVASRSHSFRRQSYNQP